MLSLIHTTAQGDKDEVTTGEAFVLSANDLDVLSADGARLREAIWNGDALWGGSHRTYGKLRLPEICGWQTLELRAGELRLPVPETILLRPSDQRGDLVLCAKDTVLIARAHDGQWNVGGIKSEEIVICQRDFALSGASVAVTVRPSTPAPRTRLSAIAERTT